MHLSDEPIRLPSEAESRLRHPSGRREQIAERLKAALSERYGKTPDEWQLEARRQVRENELLRRVLELTAVRLEERASHSDIGVFQRAGLAGDAEELRMVLAGDFELLSSEMRRAVQR